MISLKIDLGVLHYEVWGFIAHCTEIMYKTVVLKISEFMTTLESQVFVFFPHKTPKLNKNQAQS